jgi:hypothetical protein
MPEHFDELAGMVKADDLEGSLPVGPDPAEYLQQLEEYANAGLTHVYLHQIGPDQGGFLDFAKRELLPNG